MIGVARFLWQIDPVKSDDQRYQRRDTDVLGYEFVRIVLKWRPANYIPAAFMLPVFALQPRTIRQQPTKRSLAVY